MVKIFLKEASGDKILDSFDGTRGSQKLFSGEETRIFKYFIFYHYEGIHLKGVQDEVRVGVEKGVKAKEGCIRT